MTKTQTLPLIVLALAVFAGASLAYPVGAGTAAADSCGTGGAVVVAGTLAPRNSAGVPTGGVTGIGSRYADKGYAVTYVDYPTSLWPLGPISYDDDVALGKAATERAIVDYQQRCPGKPVVVAGYSQGARVAGDVLSDVANGRHSGGVRREGLSGELHSDPRRDGRDGRSGVENSLIGVLPGTTMSGPRDGGFGTIPVLEVCVEGDGVCDVPDPLYDPIGAVDSLIGYFVKHGYYPSRMRTAPDAWDSATCHTQGTTDDCVVAQPSGTSIVADDARQRAGGDATPLDVAAAAVDDRVALDLAPGVTVGSLRPIVGGQPDSSSGNLSIGASVVVAGVVDVDVQRTWGTDNSLTVGVDLGIGMTDAPAVDDALIPDTRLLGGEITVPMVDSRKLLAAALNPTR
ncbi:PE-PPE domain-containing protein [Gordonia sp. MP11Mi]|uniref:PE-PPE domain-containing protein n=1 Tax=Gordonia sp. MP11Mi TaxID=3022769 RepID=UPI003B220D38